jgi:hypothetical protein
MQSIVTPRSAGRRRVAPQQALIFERRGQLRGRAALCAVLLGVAACASSAAHHPDPADLRAMPIRPGSGLGGTRVIVLPLSTIRHGDLLGWSDAITNPRDYLVDVNAQIEHALTAGAPRTTWIFPSQLVQVASRNPGYLADPYSMDASQFAPDRWRAGGKLEDPLAGNLRTYTSFLDSRVALVPVELRFVPRPVPRAHTLQPGVLAMMHADSLHHMGRAVLRIAVVDTRTTEVMWVGDVVGDPAPAFTPAVAANLVGHLVQALANQ